MESDDEARERLIVQAIRQTYLVQIASVRAQVITGVLVATVGLGIFAVCIYIALRAGDTSLAAAALGFVLAVAGITRAIRALAGGFSARRRLRAHDAAVLPAARVIVKARPGV